MSATMQEAEAYYNNFPEKLINDYLKGNPRIENAIRFALATMRVFGSKRVLDIGCGLGWSSHEFSKNISDAQIQGVDLSANLIASAQSLFQAPNLNYAKKDVTEQDFSEHHQFDAVVMLDVYEHIPKEYRAFFHQSIKKILSKNGIMLLTCPTEFQQQRFRTTHPELMQPVDEDVTLADIEQLARDLDGEVHLFEYTKIWDEKDYFQAIIRRKGASFTENTLHSIRLEPKMGRTIRIKKSRFASILTTQSLTTRLRAMLSFLYPFLKF